MAKIERKPRRNIQYKDLANAVTHQDHLEFLEDVIPKAQSYKKIKEQAAARRAKVQGLNGPQNAAAAAAGESTAAQPANGKKSKAAAALNGTAGANGAGASSAPGSRRATLDAEDPSAQLELEMRQAHAANDEDVEMTG